jgi:hypothetical protein
MLAEARPEALPFLREKATRGGSGERACAARILWRAEGENARAFLAARVPSKRSKTVARALNELLAAAPPDPCAEEMAEADLPSWWKLALGPKAGPPDRLGTAPALAPLLAALKKEKDEAIQTSVMTVLARRGVPPEQFLDRVGLLKEAARGLAEGIPAPLSWFPFQQLPPVRWADNGRLVEPEIVRWWLAQCCQRNSPEPGPLLRRRAACLESRGRGALGRFVLEAWIRQDTQPGARAEAEPRAGQPRATPRNSKPAPPRAAAAIEAEVGFLQQPKGSAIASKGVLALAGACAAEGAAALARRYLEQWYGRRAAQCRALLQMLAWVEHPAAEQLLIAVGGGFRTRSIQEEASRQAERVAERRGRAVAI